MKFFSPRYGYALGGHYDIAGVIWRTTNSGERWTVEGISGEPLNDLWYSDSLNVFAVGGDFDFGSSTVQTRDGGANWEYAYTGVFGEARAVSFRTRTEAWVPLGWTGQYMCSFDSGRTWNVAFTPDSSSMYDVTFPDSNTGYMVGESGTILKYNSTLVHVHDGGQLEIPSTVLLYQNYPNPFNPSTIIRYALAEKTLIDITVYDIRGKRVTTLASGTQQPGSYEVLFDGGALLPESISTGIQGSS